jgi:hypothetical protein
VTLSPATTTLTTSNGDVTFSSTVDGSSAGSQALTISAGTGNVKFASTVGTGVRLGALSVTGGTGTTAYIKPTGNITAASVSLTGPVQLQSSPTIDTSTSSGAITLTSTLDALAAGTQALTLTAGSGTVTLSGVIGSVKQLASLSVTSTGSVVFGGTQAAIAGNLSISSGTLSFSSGTGDEVLSSGNVAISGTTTASNGLVLYLLPADAATTTLALPTTFPGDVVLYGPGTSGTGTVQQSSNISVGSLLVFRGTWAINGKTLTTTKDLIAYGAGYLDYTIGTLYNANDDGEIALTRATSGDPSYYVGKLGYPYFGSGTVKTVSAMNGTLDGYLSVSSTLGTGTYPTTGSMTGAFGISVAGGESITVGRNFYDYGASIGTASSGASTLNLATKWSSKTLNSSKSTDWFGLPFAVAISTSTVSGTMSVYNSTATQPVAAAQTSFGGSYTAGSTTASPIWTSAVKLVGTSGWDNTQPDIDTITANLPKTRFDNLVQVTFTKTMQDANGEALLSVGQTTYNNDNLRFASSSINAGGLYDFYAGTPGTGGLYGVGEYTTQTAANANKTTLSFMTTGKNTWATDATGTSAGATTSTDRSGNVGGWNGTTTGTNFKPDLAIEKGRLYDSSGNPIVNHDAANYNSAQSTSIKSALVTSTLDAARPVLIKIDVGQAAKNFPPTTWEDGHNYWHLTWSKPVSFYNAGTSIYSGSFGDIPGVSSGNTNSTAINAFGDSYTDSAAWNSYSFRLTGLAQVGISSNAAHLYRGTRSQYGSLGAATTSNQSSFSATNSLARSSTGNDLYIYLVGASTGSLSTYTMNWDGFWWSTDSGSAVSKQYTVPPAYATLSSGHAPVEDALGNPVEDSNVVWNAAGGTSDPKANLVLTPDSNVSSTANVTTAHRMWEFDAPSFALYLADTTGSSYEVVPISSNATDIIDQVQFHIVANESNSGQSWTLTSPVSTTHPDSAQNHFGIRDSSLTDVANGFSMKVTGAASFTNLGSLSTGTSSTVTNSLFEGTPAVPVTQQNDGYFSILLNQSTISSTLPTWKPTAGYLFSYDPTLGMVTNLTGRLLPLATALQAIDRTAPYITLTLAGYGNKVVYVQFSRKVTATTGTGNNYTDTFALSGGTNTYSVASVKFIDPSTQVVTSTQPSSGFEEALLTLSSVLTPEDLLKVRIGATTISSTSSIQASSNVMDTSVTYPISNLAIDLVQPVWASDGSGGEANTTGTAHVIHDFTGSSYLTASDITLQAKVQGSSSSSSNYTLPVQMFYDFNVASSRIANTIWLPLGIYEPSTVTAKVPATGDSSARVLNPTAVDTSGSLKTFVAPGSDSGMSNGGQMQFLFRIGSTFAVRGTNGTDPRDIGMYLIPLKAVKTQKNGVTILHNVIDPTQGQETEILYTMKKSGVATVEVFALDGSAVRILHRGRQAPGDYSVFWDGRNEGGRVVARGIYFIRVVAPDTDETRNVLVIK